MTRWSAPPTAAELVDEVAVARSRLAAAEAELADLCLRYAETRAADDTRTAASTESWPGPPPERPKPGAFAADELSAVLRRSPAQTRRLIARTRRLRTSLPEVTAAARAGVLDGEQLEEIDRAARLAQQPHTLTTLDDTVVDVAKQRTPQQLRAWLMRFLARCEPDATRDRREVRLSERRVSIAQSVTGIGYVTGEVAAEHAAAIDARLSRLAWALGATDPRSVEQRRSDLFAGLLLGTTQVITGDRSAEGTSAATAPEVLEVESIDPETGEYLGTAKLSVDADGEPTLVPVGIPNQPSTSTATSTATSTSTSAVVRESGAGPARIGVIVPLSSLLGEDETPGDLPDRSATVPAEILRDHASRDGVLFIRLLTDDGGRLLDVTELGRHASARLSEAIRIRSGTCRFPTCTVPAARCDLDHHRPYPHGPTSAANLGALCRHHHRGKTFAGLEVHRDRQTTYWTAPTAHTYTCQDDPLPLPHPGWG